MTQDSSETRTKDADTGINPIGGKRWTYPLSFVFRFVVANQSNTDQRFQNPLPMLMDNASLQNLKTLTVAFHEAIKRTDFGDTGLNLKRFPVECCHYECELLGIFLFGRGFQRIQKISGRHPDNPSRTHLWLEVDGIVVDITAYQFTGITEIIVERHSAWHSALRGKPSPFGTENEPLEDYFRRMKNCNNECYDNLYDKLESSALTFLSHYL